LESGEFQPLDEDETVAEIGLLIENLNCRSYLTSDQMCNLLWELEGKLPDHKQAMLDTISQYLAKHPLERLRFCLQRRLSSYLGVYGGLGEEAQVKVQLAVKALEAETPDAKERVEAALAALKQAFI
jgi:hypothetical protein